MSGAVIGGNIRYPNLQQIADLFRFGINDTFNNVGGSGTGSGGGAGLIMPNSNPDLITMLNEGISELFSDLRNVGDPELILDNYILKGLPALTKADPAVQVSIGFNGFFDGFQVHPLFTLPISASKIIALWERQTNSNDDFCPMVPAPFGLPGVMQGNRMGSWEMRQNAIWMPGCLQQTDIRIRARITFPEFIGNSANINFNTAYVPIVDSKNAIVSKMRVQYAIRFAPEQYPLAIQEETRQMDKLKLEVVRQMQTQENQRAEFGGEAVTDFAIAWSFL